MPISVPYTSKDGELVRYPLIQANGASFEFTHSSGTGFTGYDSIRLELRKQGVSGADGLLARTITLVASGSSLTIDFTAAQMNQHVAGDQRDYDVSLYGLLGATRTTIWQAVIELHADEAGSSATDDPPAIPAATRRATVVLAAGSRSVVLSGANALASGESIIGIVHQDTGVILEGIDAADPNTINFTASVAVTTNVFVTIAPL
jgi:hypothetical protein